jgi:hypothetical protein
MDIYAAYLPKATRWQVELMADAFEDRGEVQRVLATIACVERLTARTNALLSPASIRAVDTATRSSLHRNSRMMPAPSDQPKVASSFTPRPHQER